MLVFSRTDWCGKATGLIRLSREETRLCLSDYIRKCIRASKSRADKPHRSIVRNGMQSPDSPGYTITIPRKRSGLRLDSHAAENVFTSIRGTSRFTYALHFASNCIHYTVTLRVDSRRMVNSLLNKSTRVTSWFYVLRRYLYSTIKIDWYPINLRISNLSISF